MTAAPAHNTRRVLSRSAINGLAYAAAQAINFAVQLLIVHQLGKETFGNIGIAQTCVLSLIFIAELGMPSYFIREASIRSNWRHQWRHGCIWRALTLLVGTAGLLIFWRSYYGAALPGLHYILFATPGMFLSILNPTPLLIAQGRANRAAAGLLILWLTYAAIAVSALYFFPAAYADAGIGAAFSLGYLAYTIFLARRVEWQSLTNDPAAHAHNDMLKRSVTVWIPALLGTLYALLLAFSVQHLAPAILVYFLLGNQIMQGISGLNLQMQRVLLSTLASEHQTQPDSPLLGTIFSLTAKLICAMIFVLFALLCITDYLIDDLVIPAHMLAFTLMLAERLLGVMGSFLVTSLMARHREFLIFRVMLITYLVSMAAQFAITYVDGNLCLILALRLITSILQMVIFYRALRCKLSPLPIIGTAIILALGFVPYATNIMPYAAAFTTFIAALLCCASLQHYRHIHRTH